MDGRVSAEELARLWDRYAEAARRYGLAKQATDAAEAACQRAYEACEAAYAEEVTWAQAVGLASRAFQAAADAAFLAANGIQIAGPLDVMKGSENR